VTSPPFLPPERHAEFAGWLAAFKDSGIEVPLDLIRQMSDVSDRAAGGAMWQYGYGAGLLAGRAEVGDGDGPAGEWVYLIGPPPPAAGPVKIGWTTIHPDRRIIRLRRNADNTICPPTVDRQALAVLWSAAGDQALERALHSAFKPHRLVGEWFALAPADAITLVPEAVEAHRNRPGTIEAAVVEELAHIPGGNPGSALAQGVLKLARVLDRRPEDDGAAVTARVFQEFRAALQQIRRLAHDEQQRAGGPQGDLGTPVWDAPNPGPADVGAETGGGRPPVG
jgi:hypothetical protein